MPFNDAGLLAPKSITQAAFLALSSGTRRICFGTTHSEALRRATRSGRYEFFLNLPFRDTIGPMLARDLMISLKESNRGRYWAGFDDDEDVAPLQEWIGARQELVFIRDLLDLSVALAINYDDEGRTALGELEYQAKFHQCTASLDEIVEKVNAFIDSSKFYKSCDAVCAVPPRPDKDFDLPTEIARKIARHRNIPLVTSGTWENGKPSLKSVAIEDKWSALAEGNLTFDKKELEGKRVLLLDDLYQSGTTLNFVAGALRSHGAKRVFGLAVVKSRRDTDNS